MNYSKKRTHKNNGLRWLIASWVFFFVIGAVAGAVTVNIIKKSPEPPKVETTTPANDFEPLYGTRDGRVFTDEAEMSRDWSGGELDFKPLDVPLCETVQEFIFYLSYGYYIDFPFVMGLIMTESSFRTHVISKTHDYGLMQINRVNHKWLEERHGITDFLDPYENVKAGLYILRTLFEKYDDPAKVLMAYHMGETGAGRLWEKGIFETSYTRKVLTYAENYRRELENNEN